ncbi:MAG: BT4734/BF3469 family protein [Saprospiraceae bacterium]
MPDTHPQQSVLNAPVSWFEGARLDANGEPRYNPHPGGAAPLLRLIQPTYPATLATIEAIRREPDPARRKALKATLPAFTPSGQFTRRGAAHLVTHSGLIQFDIDGADNRHIGNFADLKREICNIPNVAYCGLSVSGGGYWGLVPIAYPERHKGQYKALQRAFKQWGIVIDTKCSDVSRLRYVSSDPEGYVNHFPELFYLVEREEIPATRQPAGNQAGNRDWQRVEICVQQVEARQIVLAPSPGGYLTWSKIKCALAAAFGEAGRDFFHRVSHPHPEYDPTETDKQYTAALAVYYRYSFSHLGTFFSICAEHSIYYRDKQPAGAPIPAPAAEPAAKEPAPPPGESKHRREQRARNVFKRRGLKPDANGLKSVLEHLENLEGLEACGWVFEGIQPMTASDKAACERMMGKAGLLDNKQQIQIG